jgi:hypothetical protein
MEVYVFIWSYCWDMKKSSLNFTKCGSIKSGFYCICLSEHYLSTQNLLLINLENYYLGSSFSRTINHGGGVCIYIRKDILLIMMFRTIVLKKS